MRISNLKQSLMKSNTYFVIILSSIVASLVTFHFISQFAIAPVLADTVLKMVYSSAPKLIYNSSGVVFEYPIFWEPTDYPSLGFISIYGSSYNSSVEFEAPNDMLYFGVENLPLKSDISAAEYIQAHIQEQKGRTTNFKLVNQSHTTLADLPAYRSIASYKDSLGTIKELTIVAIKNDKVYYISYAADESEYPRFYPIVQDTIKSFRIQSQNVNP